MTIRTADAATKTSVDTALRHLRAARGELRKANCPRALEKVRRAIDSTEGAKRHCDHRCARSPA
ncbi:hypothetical protein PF049_13765 (plasmid) [Erythrobacteraceae bacterium WH01K]|nr:hypothetical protein PF049_13765 [Erythrobacteraceae bacterium WH01K]